MTTPALTPAAKARATERATSQHMRKYLLFCEQEAGKSLTRFLLSPVYREAARAHAKLMLAVTAAETAAMLNERTDPRPTRAEK